MNRTTATAATARNSSRLAARLETHLETHIQRGRQPFQHRQGRNGPAGLESGNCGLGHPRGLRQLCLTPAPALAKLTNGTTEFERQPRGVVRLRGTWLGQPPLSHSGPTATLAHDLVPLVHDLVRLVDAPCQCPACPVDLPLVPHPRLVEDRQSASA